MPATVYLLYVRTSESSSVPSGSPPPLTESPLTAFAGVQLEVDYQVHELPDDNTDNTAEETTPWPSVPTSEDQSLVSAGLIAHIEVLEAENMMLKTCLSSKGTARFGIEKIKHDDCLISFYAGSVPT